MADNEKIDFQFIKYISGIFGATDSGLTNSEIGEFLAKYTVEFGKMYTISHGMTKKSEKLCTAIWSFNGEQQYKIIEDLCRLPRFEGAEEVEKIENLLHTKYHAFSNNPLTQNTLLIKAKHMLDNYPGAKNEFESACKKVEQGQFERNALDDMRLSLELLVKAILENEKSLENNRNIIMTKLKEKKAANEIRNLFDKVLDYYAKYQNDHVKHNAKVDKNELEFIINLTSIMMSYLINTLGKVSA